MIFDQILSKDLRNIIDKVEDLFDKISIDERRIAKIDKHEWAIAYAGILLRIIISKTSARYLPVECVKDFMDKEVKRGDFEKVKLNDDDILYKSKNPKFLNSIKSVTLEID